MRALAFLALLLAACNDDLAKPELIENLRVLAIRAEPPDGPPGTTVTFDALVVTPDDAEVDTVWLACATPAAGLSATACVEAAGGNIPPPCSEGPAEVCLLGLGAPEPYVLPAISGQVYVAMVAAERAKGGLIGCQAQLLDEKTVPDYCRVALKRVPVVAAGGARNGNPGIESLTITGEDAVVRLAPGAAETTADGPEALFLSWFVTAGELDSFRTDGDAEGLHNLWMPPDQPGRLWVVVRDGRGGESWAEGTR